MDELCERLLCRELFKVGALRGVGFRLHAPQRAQLRHAPVVVHLCGLHPLRTLRIRLDLAINHTRQPFRLLDVDGLRRLRTGFLLLPSLLYLIHSEGLLLELSLRLLGLLAKRLSNGRSGGAYVDVPLRHRGGGGLQQRWRVGGDLGPHTDSLAHALL